MAAFDGRTKRALKQFKRFGQGVADEAAVRYRGLRAQLGNNTPTGTATPRPELAPPGAAEVSPGAGGRGQGVQLSDPNLAPPQTGQQRLSDVAEAKAKNLIPEVDPMATQRAVTTTRTNGLRENPLVGEKVSSDVFNEIPEQVKKTMSATERAAQQGLGSDTIETNRADGSRTTSAERAAATAEKTRLAAMRQANAIVKKGTAGKEAIAAALKVVNSGGTAEAVGEFFGTQGKSVNAGIDKSVPFSSDAAAIEAEAPLNRPAASPDDVVLKGNAKPGLGQAQEFVGPTQAAPEQPKAQKSVFDKIKNAIPGLGGSDTPVDPSAKTKASASRVKAAFGPAAILDIGTMWSNEVAQFGLEGGTESAAKKTGITVSEIADLVEAGEWGEILKGFAIGAADLPGRIASNVPTTLASGFRNVADVGAAASDLVGLEQGADVFRDASEGASQFITDVNDPNYAGDNRAVGLINSFKHGSVADVDQVPGALRELTGRSTAPQVADQSSAATSGASSPPPPAGLRQDASAAPPQRSPFVPPGLNQDRRQITDEQYAVNNLRTNEIAADQEPGTGFMQSRGPDGNFETFIDGRGQPEPAPQERGLGAARNEILGRGRFDSENPLANFAGEFAASRIAAGDKNRDAINNRSAAGLARANSTADTARRTADAKLESEFYKGLNNPDTFARTRDRVFQNFMTAKNSNQLDANSAAFRTASTIATRALLAADKEGLLARFANTIGAPLGTGQGLMDLFQGSASVNAGFPFADMEFRGNELFVKSTDGDMGWKTFGEFEDPDVANFLRQNVTQIGQ